MTVMTTERPTIVAQPQAGSLAIRADQTMWTPEQAAVLRQSGISDDVTNAELAGFLHLCQRTGLDPFSRQIYLIGRKDRRAGRVVFTPQTGIDGYRVIAQRVTAQTGGTYGYEDFLWCDSAGRWRDVWLSEQPPAAAKVTVIRNGQKFSAVATFREYAQTFPDGNPSGLWGKMHAGQVAKCAEALALRKAFPHDLAGVYTAEEMAQADNPQPAPQFQRQAPGQDTWETAAPAPQQQTPPEVVAAGTADVPPESLTPAGHDYLHEVHAAPDQATARRIYDDAKAEGASPQYLAQIAKVGMTKPEKAQPSDAEIAADTARARDEMFRAARDAALTPEQADAGFTARYGTPATYGTAVQLREYAAALTAPQAPAAEPVADTLPGAPATAQDRLGALAQLYAAAHATGMSEVEARQVLAQETGGKTTATATGDEIAAVTAALREAAGGAR